VAKAAPGLSYFTPAQDPVSGSAVDPQPDGRAIPILFQKLRIRGVDFQNRIWVCILNCVKTCLKLTVFRDSALATLPILCP
jgi:hypothetical protein